MVLKYCRLSDGNLSNSADIKGIIKSSPCRQTSEAETPSSGALASGGAKSIDRRKNNEL